VVIAVLGLNAGNPQFYFIIPWGCGPKQALIRLGFRPLGLHASHQSAAGRRQGGKGDAFGNKRKIDA